jgi:hypothetical protein
MYTFLFPKAATNPGATMPGMTIEGGKGQPLRALLECGDAETNFAA